MGRVSSRVLIGRQRELDMLVEAIDPANADRPSAFVVSGEAGIGKTRLLREVKELSRAHGAAMLTGGCIPLTEGALPYAPVTAALREGVKSLFDPATAVLPEDSVAELARLLPEFRSAASDQVSATDQTRLFGAVLDLVRVLAAAAPLIFVIEDVHWSDASTRDLLTYLLNTTEDEPILFLCSLRTGEIASSHPVSAWVRTLTSSRMAEVVELLPLSREESRQQMNEITGKEVEEEVVHKIYERSQGNPFFVEELIQVGRPEDERLPPSIRDLFFQRITAIPHEAEHTLKAAAVGGPTISHELLAEVTAMEDEELTRAVQILIDRHVLVKTDDDRYGFRHALVREAVYGRLLPGEKKSLHRSFASALEEKGTQPGPVRLSARLARHWDEAREPQLALPHALAAATDAGEKYASSEALAHYEHSLELWVRVPDAESLCNMAHVDLLELAAQTAHSAGEPERSVDLWRAAIDLLDPVTNPGRAARQRSSLAYVLGATLMDFEASGPLVQEARDLVSDLPPSVEKAEVLSFVAESLTLMGRFDEGLAMARSGMEIASQLGDRAQLGNAHAALGLAHQTAGDAGTAIEHHLVALEIERETGQTSLMGKTFLNLSDALFRANRPEEAVACALGAVDELHRLGDHSHSGFLTCNAGEFLVALGRFEEAREIIGPLEDAGFLADRSFSTSLLAEIDTQQGRFEDARRRLGAARRLLGETNQPQFLDPVIETEILLALCERRYEEASALVQQAWMTPREHRSSARLCALGLRVEADRAARARATRSIELEQQAIDRGEGIQKRCPDMSSMLEVDASHKTVLAEASRLRGSSDPHLWQLAADAWAEVSYRSRRAYALYRCSESLLASRASREAREALSEAARLAEEMGAAPLSLEIAGLARRARLRLSGSQGNLEEAALPGGDPSERGQLDGLGLTKRELEVMYKLADGLTNKQIAEALYISPKTASIHVSNILTKLGVSSRTEAARRAYDAGLLERSETT